MSPTSSRSVRGVSLAEMAIAAAILAILSVPVITVFISSKQGITRTDTRRDHRYYLTEIVAHAGRQALHDLWDNFGPGEVVGFDVAGRLHHRIAEFDDVTGAITGKNPLGFTPEFLRDLTVRDGYDARFYFEFYRRADLGITPAVFDPGQPDRVSQEIGIFHMQAGWGKAVLLDRQKLTRGGREADAVVATWQEPIMCPAVVGRPGLKMAGCPALNPVKKLQYAPLLAMRESAN